MGQTVQTLPIKDQNGVNQTIPANIKTPGVFVPTKEETIKYGSGPIFAPLGNSSQSKTKIDGVKKPENATQNMLESLDIKRLVSILTQEAIKIANFGDRATAKDRESVIRALYELNPRKYPFAAVNEDKFQPKDIVLPSQKEIETPVLSVKTFPELSPSNDDEIFNQTEQQREISNTSEVESLLVAEEETVSKKIPESEEILTPANKQEEVLVNTVDKYKEEIPEVISGPDLFDTLHSPKIENVPAPEIKTMDVIEKTENEIKPPQQELDKKHTNVSKLLDLLLSRAGQDWKRLVTPIVIKNTNTTPQEDLHLPSNLQIEQIKSWRENPKAKEMISFINDISSMREEGLIAKYVPSYVNPNNPASWASVSSFGTYEIINGQEGIYGLPTDGRYEVSSIIKNLWEIHRVISGKNSMFQDYVTSNEGVSIGDLIAETKKEIASADNQK